MAGQAEVNEFEHVALNRLLRQEKKVLRLKVTVRDVFFMHVANCTQNLLHHDCSLMLCESTCFDNPVKQLATFAQLHDQINPPRIFKDLKQFDDIRVVHHLHDLDLLLELRNIPHLAFLDRLDCAQDACGSPRSFPHDTIATLAQDVVFHLVSLMDVAPSLKNQWCSILACGSHELHSIAQPLLVLAGTSLRTTAQQCAAHRKCNCGLRRCWHHYGVGVLRQLSGARAHLRRRPRQEGSTKQWTDLSQT
mmetsp:Transcript_80197/g.208402  ORF Transcript_80197/g.208402 Transcript_80197/m.208402 type:complete len:249 (+) Transcript_80197:1161-1907(+)